MPAPIRSVANWNPVSAVTAAARQPLGQPQPARDHPRLADAASRPRGRGVVGRHIAVFAPLATLLYRRRTTD